MKGGSWTPGPTKPFDRVLQMFFFSSSFICHFSILFYLFVFHICFSFFFSDGIGPQVHHVNHTGPWQPYNFHSDLSSYCHHIFICFHFIFHFCESSLFLLCPFTIRIFMFFGNFGIFIIVGVIGIQIVRSILSILSTTSCSDNFRF